MRSECPSSYHCKLGPLYDGRIVVTRSMDDRTFERCMVCGEEWICFHQRRPELVQEVINQELMHVRSHAEQL